MQQPARLSNQAGKMRSVAQREKRKSMHGGSEVAKGQNRLRNATTGRSCEKSLWKGSMNIPGGGGLIGDIFRQRGQRGRVKERT